jgi:hypothetical protein
MITLENDEAVAAFINFLQNRSRFFSIEREYDEFPEGIREIYSIYLNYDTTFAKRLIFSVYSFSYYRHHRIMRVTIHDENCKIIIRHEEDQQHLLELLNKQPTGDILQKVATSVVRYLKCLT